MSTSSRLHVITVGGNHPIDFDIVDPSDEQRDALRILSDRLGHLVFDPNTCEHPAEFQDEPDFSGVLVKVRCRLCGNIGLFD